MHRFLSTLAEEQLQTAIAALPEGSAPFAILHIGFGDFTSGRSRADQEKQNTLLLAAQRRLKEAVRAGELVLYLPNGEFVVLLQSVNSVVRAGAAADRLFSLLHQPFALDGASWTTVVSLGVALGPDDGRTAHILARRAATAYKHARATGSDLVQFFEPAMEEVAGKSRPLSLEARMAALLREWQSPDSTHLRLAEPLPAR